MCNGLLKFVAFKRVHFIYILEAPDVQVEFIILFRYLSLFLIRVVDEFSIYFIIFISFISGSQINLLYIFLFSLNRCILLSGIDSIAKSKCLLCCNNNQ